MSHTRNMHGTNNTARITAVLTAAIWLSGCGGGMSNTASNQAPSTSASNPSISGNWQVTLSSSQQTPSGLYLTQTGQNVTGGLAPEANTEFDCALTGGVTLLGTFQSNALSLSMGPSQTSNVSISAQLGPDGNSLSGTYSITNVGMCSKDQGTITGTPFPSLAGQWIGAGTSSMTGQNVQISLSLTEPLGATSCGEPWCISSPDIYGFPVLIGSGTVHGSCFSGLPATFVGDQRGSAISGPEESSSTSPTSALVSEIEPNVSPSATMFLTTLMTPPPTASSITLTYSAMGGECAGTDTGTIVLTPQQ